MKKFVVTVCSAMMLSIGTIVAQNQDNTSPNYNQRAVEENKNQGTVEENKDNTVDNSSNEVKQGTVSTEEQVREGGNPTPEQTDQVTQDQATPTNEMGEPTPIIDKVGPHGEQLFMENKKYYYLNENGDKVKVNKSKLKDKSQ